jgi:hypothetical protein
MAPVLRFAAVHPQDFPAAGAAGSLQSLSQIKFPSVIWTL